MSIRDAFENCLTELNKVQAPSLLLEDFVYLFNKAVQQYINLRYTLFETKQQLTDDLRVLLKTHKEDFSPGIPGSFEGPTVDLPSDYMHILNCICTFQETEFSKCDRKRTVTKGANKMDTTQWPHVIENYYMQPSVKQPYYYIMNVDNPSQPNDSIQTGSGSYIRYGNSVKPTLQMKYGSDSKWALKEVRIDYLRAPYYYTLTQDELDSIADNSMIIEFPDYVIYEIMNILVRLVLENGSNPRIQTHMGVNQTIS